jgi:hypothetical protein
MQVERASLTGREHEVERERGPPVPFDTRRQRTGSDIEIEAVRDLIELGSADLDLSDNIAAQLEVRTAREVSGERTLAPATGNASTRGTRPVNGSEVPTTLLAYPAFDERTLSARPAPSL